ncbi:glycosyltransferase family 2 protein [Chryseosolibacter indicus]|uniref:Glycosyltransferase n=1 Tax=Chryseosolibacter indicus TaxID=2782351 RepID=A0ABS5VQT9_9BACT|nr:glycosyltransferase [Chryseosolibacter indicus]MBT1703815.1 glycosyltransferase [Chryseosolibacter indicus]
MEVSQSIKVSVVIPTYKRPVLLLRCIDALLQQDFSRDLFEIIIVSDGPDEITQREFNKVKSKTNLNVYYYALPQKKGPAAARNMGWRKAAGELIAFTDDDCMPGSKWLSVLYQTFVQKGLEEIAFSGRTIVPIPKVPTDYEKNISNLERAEFITANCACSKKALLKVGGLDEQFTMAWREDSDLHFKLILHGVPVITLKNAIVTHPVRKAPWGISLQEQRKGIFNALLFKKYPRLYRERIQPNPPLLYYFILLCLLLFLIGASAPHYEIKIAGLCGWIGGTLWFTAKRLSSTSRSFSHVMEMILTSLLIPYLSLYYRIYGALKFKAPLIP